VWVAKTKNSPRRHGKERWSRIVGLSRDELAVNLKESKQ
jgi:hypothetical protein